VRGGGGRSRGATEKYGSSGREKRAAGGERARAKKKGLKGAVGKPLDKRSRKGMSETGSEARVRKRSNFLFGGLLFPQNAPSRKERILRSGSLHRSLREKADSRKRSRDHFREDSGQSQLHSSTVQKLWNSTGRRHRCDGGDCQNRTTEAPRKELGAGVLPLSCPSSLERENYWAELLSFQGALTHSASAAQLERGEVRMGGGGGKDILD